MGRPLARGRDGELSLVIEKKCALYDADRTMDPEREWLEAGTVFLPLSDDGADGEQDSDLHGIQGPQG